MHYNGNIIYLRRSYVNLCFKVVHLAPIVRLWVPSIVRLFSFLSQRYGVRRCWLPQRYVFVLWFSPMNRCYWLASKKGSMQADISSCTCLCLIFSASLCVMLLGIPQRRTYLYRLRNVRSSTICENFTTLPDPVSIRISVRSSLCKTRATPDLRGYHSSLRSSIITRPAGFDIWWHSVYSNENYVWKWNHAIYFERQA